MAGLPESLPPLIVVTGKGGVGKTLVSCAVARLRAAAGERVLLLELDARESLHRFLGCSPSDGRVVRASETLDVQNLRPRDVVDGLIEQRVKPGWVARRVLRSVIYEQFVQGAPGLREVAALGHAMNAAGGEGEAGAYDLVILDAPATGHGVSLLLAPGLLSTAIGSGPVGELGAQVAAMVDDPAACALWAVSTAEGMALRETVELDAALERGLGRGLDLLVLNRLLPETAGGRNSPEWLDPWRRRVATQVSRLAALRATWRRPMLRLPLSAGDGRAALDEVEAVLAGGGLE